MLENMAGCECEGVANAGTLEALPFPADRVIVCESFASYGFSVLCCVCILHSGIRPVHSISGTICGWKVRL